MLRSPKEIRDEIDKDLVQVMRGWRERPVDFCRDILRFEPLAWQIEFMQAVADSRLGKLEKRRFAVRSGTGVGKSAGVACLILWHLACFFDSKIGITAPTAPLLRAVLLPECAKWIRNIPVELKDVFPYDPQTDRILLHDNFAVARTSREGQSESMQGLHASNILMIFEEASGVAESSFLASQGVMSEEGAITIYIGNPTRAVGPFYDAFHGDSDLFWTKRVGCQDSERVSPKYIQEMREKHGEDSYEFKVRVLGEFHLEASGVVIPRPWIDEAMTRYVEPDSDWIVWGFDVSDGRDKSALARRCGNRLLGIHSWGGKEVLQSVGMVADWYWECDEKDKPDEICVDAIGMGATAAQRLAEVLKGEPVKVTKVNVALTGSQIGERFTSFRVELWDRGRKWFESGLVSILGKSSNEQKLAAELSSVEWEVKDSNGKWAIVDKKASGHSPDCFVAGTMVKTFGGETPIEKIKIGQKVLTPFGYKKVIKVWESDAETITDVNFSNGVVLSGKGKHKVFTSDLGFVRMDSLLLTSGVETYSFKRILLWMYQRLLFIKAKSSGFKQVAAIINQGEKTLMKDYIIAESCQTLTALSRAAMIFITLMEIGEILLSKTLSALKDVSMGAITWLKDFKTLNMLQKIKLTFQKQYLRPQNGIQVKKVLSGTQKMGKRLGQIGARSKQIALCAIKSLKLIFCHAQNTVLKSAQMLIRTKPSKIVSEIVNYVANPLCVTDIRKPLIVPTSVQTRIVHTPVKTYNLTLDRENVYYANGVLVDNCADSFLLTFAGLKRGKSSFTKDKKGRRIVTSMETSGVGSASYLAQGVSHEHRYTH